MAKVTGPLLSLGASGSIADTFTFGKWKGIPYARAKVSPSNPNSVGQQAQRTLFATALAKAHIPNLKFHDLRHTFASHFVMNGGDLLALKDLLGHSSLKMVLLILHQPTSGVLSTTYAVNFQTATLMPPKVFKRKKPL